VKHPGDGVRPLSTRIEPTVAGKILLPLGVSLATIAWAAGGAANLLAATVWAVLLVDAAAGLLVARGLRAAPPDLDRSFAGELRNLELAIQASPGPFAPRAVSLHTSGVRGDRPAGFTAELRRGRTSIVSFAKRWTERGPVKRLSVDLATAHPLGLLRVRKRFELPIDVLVLPRPLPLADLTLLAPVQGLQATIAHARRQGNEEFHSLHAWRQGESMRRVHWKHSMRRGALYRREHEGPGRPELRLVLETRTLAGESASRSFERAVRLVASLAAHHLRDGRRVRLVIGSDELPAARGRTGLWPLLAALARVKNERGTASAARFDPPARGEELMLVMAGGGRGLPDAPRGWTVLDIDAPGSDLYLVRELQGQGAA
jgi:uncharacterized protein (DUF58 family)